MAHMTLTLTSAAFEFGGRFPLDYTCDGGNVSPRLGWMHAPDGTQSFTLLMEDVDADEGSFTHWILFDLPAGARGVAPGENGGGKLGRNDFQGIAYAGPCPPPQQEHRYFITLYALDIPSLDLGPGATRAQVEAAMRGHVLQETKLMGKYSR